MESVLSKTTYFEILRVICCIFVIANHTLGNVIFFPNIGLSTQVISIAYFMISKVAVPIFIMITGALLIKKEITYEILFKKYIFKLIKVIFIFSLINYILLNNTTIDLIGFFKNIFVEPVIWSYWYLYLLIGIYLMLPIITKMVKNFSEKDYLYFFIIWIGFIGIIPFMRIYYPSFNLLPNTDLPLFSGYIGYLIAGHYLNNFKIDYQKKIFIIIPIMLITFVIGLSTYLTYREQYTLGRIELRLDNINLITTIIPSLCIFYLVRYYGDKINSDKVKNLFGVVGRTTFGVYLIHGTLTEYLLRPLQLNLMDKISPLIGTLIFQIIIFIISMLITKLLLYIPGIKKLL